MNNLVLLRSQNYDLLLDENVKLDEETTSRLVICSANCLLGRIYIRFLSRGKKGERESREKITRVR